MSAISSNSGDRDLEALHRAQEAHEPSMDEILASIRNIIAEKREPAMPAPPKGPPQRLAIGPQIVYSKELPALDPVAPAEIDQAEAAPTGEANPPTVVWRQRDPAGVGGAEDLSVRTEEPLLSSEANDAVASSFEALSASLALRSAELADGLVREMLRPMLKAWLDENLPSIVDRLVRAEIQRIARGPR
jgi:uncharacterized protein